MQLHDYQLVARDFLRGQPRAALFLDMGLGKTAASLAALTPDHLPVLVVAPKRVAETVWEAETALWRPDLTCRVAKGTPQQRRAVLEDSRADIYVIGRDNLKDLLGTRQQPPAWLAPTFRTIILDELSGFKTKSSVRWKAAAKIIRTHQSPYVWGLTGTPSPNGFLDLWGQIALLDQGERLGKNLTTYRGRYFRPGRQLPSGVIIEWLLRPGAEDQIKAQIQDICLAMATDGRIKLPEVTYNDLTIELPAPVMAKYRELEKTLVVDLREIFDGEIHTAGNAATLTARLSQMTSGFIYVDEADVRAYEHTILHREKVAALKEIQEANPGQPILVFYRFTAERKMLQEAFPEAWAITEPDVVKKWNNGDVPMLLAHPASAGHGLNLQHGGHIVVWTSPTWDLEHWDQANKRLARQGQKHPVVIHSILAKSTIDQLVRQRLAEKSDVQQDLLAYLESPL